jgi:hypothetical protein
MLSALDNGGKLPEAASGFGGLANRVGNVDVTLYQKIHHRPENWGIWTIFPRYL